MVFSLLYGCGGGGGDNSTPPPPPDLSGVWAGAWQGTDVVGGVPREVSGTWTVTINQGATSASGPGTLFGDVDCMDGQMGTNPSGTAVTGSVTRAPCGTVNWTLTALSVSAGSASGTWNNALTGGAGTMSGTRIATLNGPRINFVSPPGGKPGAWVTVVGQSLSGLTALHFNQTLQPTVLPLDATRMLARVPVGATTGAVQVTTSGVALSPVLFNLDVIAPPLALGGSMTQGISPSALAVSPDGRKFYIADRASNSVSVVRAATLVTIVTRTGLGGSPRSVVASPDGKRIYVAAAGIGVLNMDAAIASEINRVTFLIDDGGRDNPQGIAISPDGRLLAVSTGTSVNGSVRVFSISGDTLTPTITYNMPAGIAALGVAFAPDGSQVYVAAADPVGSNHSLRVFHPATGVELDFVVVGALPTAIAVHPTGDLVFVSNKTDNTVSIYNSVTKSIVTTVPSGGTSPTGIAYSPDGTRVYVANNGSSNIGVLNGTSGAAVTGSPLGVAAGPLAIAINATGATAYVSQLNSATVREVGGMRTLTINRGGTGIGTVQSNPPGINCGTSCQAQFPVGTAISLTATAQGGSFFSGFSGGCSSSFTLNATMNCTATFNSNAPPPNPQQPPSGGDDCFIATAAYGSDMAREVAVLRQFRGEWLMTNAAGRAFVRMYYRNSPPVADLIRESDGARAAVRGVLLPIVWSIENPAAALSFFLFSLLLGAGLRLRSRAARP
jgi:YVTN family beta-propeller protein